MRSGQPEKRKKKVHEFMGSRGKLCSEIGNPMLIRGDKGCL